MRMYVFFCEFALYKCISNNNDDDDDDDNDNCNTQ